MPLNDAYCNALLLACWAVRQRLNHVSLVQFCGSLRIFRQPAIAVSGSLIVGKNHRPTYMEKLTIKWLAGYTGLRVMVMLYNGRYWLWP